MVGVAVVALRLGFSALPINRGWVCWAFRIVIMCITQTRTNENRPPGLARASAGDGDPMQLDAANYIGRRYTMRHIACAPHLSFTPFYYMRAHKKQYMIVKPYLSTPPQVDG